MSTDIIPRSPPDVVESLAVNDHVGGNKVWKDQS